MKYRTIVADPPWDYRSKVRMGSGPKHKGPNNHYQTMSVDWLVSIDIHRVAETDAHLYLWATNAFVVEAHHIAQFWGFEPRTLLTWVKPGLGTGPFYRSNTEHVVFAVRGSLPVARHDQPTAFTWSRQSHSQKPEAFLDLVEQMSPGPYLELFARRQRLGWDTWGNEAFCHVDLEAPA